MSTELPAVGTYSRSCGKNGSVSQQNYSISLGIHCDINVLLVYNAISLHIRILKTEDDYSPSHSLSGIQALK